MSAAVGIAEVVRDAYVNPEFEDAKLAVCDVRAKAKFPRAVTLKEIKAHPDLKDWDLVRLARLSVVEVNDEQWKFVRELAEVKP